MPILSLYYVEKFQSYLGHFPGRERDEHDVTGYYAALAQNMINNG